MSTPAIKKESASGATAPGDRLLEVRDLAKFFPVSKGLLQRHAGDVKAVDGLNFDINRRQTLSLVGESGCGKTTAGRSLLRLIEPTRGSAMLHDADGGRVDLFKLSQGEMRKYRRHLQIIFQDPYASLNPRITVGNSIGEALKVHGIAKGSGLEDRVSALLERVGLRAAVRNRYPHEFSGGQRQRIGIARALALRPEFIVCDEAVSALDVSVQAQVINLLKDLQSEFGLSYLFIAHDLSVVKFMADMMAVMKDGKFVEFGPSEAIYRDPKQDYTRKLIEATPRDDLQHIRDLVARRADQREK